MGPCLKLIKEQWRADLVLDYNHSGLHACSQIFLKGVHMCMGLVTTMHVLVTTAY